MNGWKANLSPIFLSKEEPDLTWFTKTMITASRFSANNAKVYE